MRVLEERLHTRKLGGHWGPHHQSTSLTFCLISLDVSEVKSQNAHKEKDFYLKI